MCQIPFSLIALSMQIMKCYLSVLLQDSAVNYTDLLTWLINIQTLIRLRCLHIFNDWTKQTITDASQTSVPLSVITLSAYA